MSSSLSNKLPLFVRNKAKNADNAKGESGYYKKVSDRIFGSPKDSKVSLTPSPDEKLGQVSSFRSERKSLGLSVGKDSPQKAMELKPITFHDGDHAKEEIHNPRNEGVAVVLFGSKPELLSGESDGSNIGNVGEESDVLTQISMIKVRENMKRLDAKELQRNPFEEIPEDFFKDKSEGALHEQKNEPKAQEIPRDLVDEGRSPISPSERKPFWFSVDKENIATPLNNEMVHADTDLPHIKGDEKHYTVDSVEDVKVVNPRKKKNKKKKEDVYRKDPVVVTKRSGAKSEQVFDEHHTFAKFANSLLATVSKHTIDYYSDRPIYFSNRYELRLESERSQKKLIEVIRRYVDNKEAVLQIGGGTWLHKTVYPGALKKEDKGETETYRGKIFPNCGDDDLLSFVLMCILSGLLQTVLEVFRNENRSPRDNGRRHVRVVVAREKYVMITHDARLFDYETNSSLKSLFSNINPDRSARTRTSNGNGSLHLDAKNYKQYVDQLISRRAERFSDDHAAEGERTETEVIIVPNTYSRHSANAEMDRLSEELNSVYNLSSSAPAHAFNIVSNFANVKEMLFGLFNLNYRMGTNSNEFHVMLMDEEKPLFSSPEATQAALGNCRLFPKNQEPLRLLVKAEMNWVLDKDRKYDLECTGKNIQRFVYELLPTAGVILIPIPKEDRCSDKLIRELNALKGGVVGEQGKVDVATYMIAHSLKKKEMLRTLAIIRLDDNEENKRGYEKFRKAYTKFSGKQEDTNVFSRR